MYNNPLCVITMCITQIEVSSITFYLYTRITFGLVSVSLRADLTESYRDNVSVILTLACNVRIQVCICLFMDMNPCTVVCQSSM